MEIKVLAFGKITDIIGVSELKLQNIHSSDELINLLQTQYPKLKETKFVIAVDKKIISETVLLEDKSTVALLPPFSGG
jgi:molybdopterin synthase sulfur carrier subunit